MQDEREQNIRDIQREYLDFLDDGEEQRVYSEKVKEMINNNEVRIVVNINDLRKKKPKRAHALLTHGFEEQLAFARALKEMAGASDPTYGKTHEELFVAFEGSFGTRHVTPRTLTSHFLGNLVCVEGIVTKCSLVRPKVVRSVHYCPATKKSIERRYQDLTSMDAFPSSSAYPTKDEDGNLLETEFGLSTFKDHQTLSIQEMPEKAPAGQLPRSVDVVLDNDLVDQSKPGDRVQIIGTYRCLPNKQGGFTSGSFRTIVIANNVSLVSKDAQTTIYAEDVKQCKKLKKQKKNIFELLSHSLAPSIHGHEYVKKALLCMLLGGVEKVLPNGTRLRGDINILLIGDPSVAKSQMLRYVLNTAPRAVATTGRGTTGVGLTAAVTTDQESNERRLEAGAMVLADRGVVCIDEFDKMSDMDRTAIHEVMEQGRVTIAKAGIHASLNARCSVLAAANPIYGRYDQYKTPMENINLQDSLLSRFDLLFILLDTVDAENDRLISDHVVRMHRYRNPNEQDGEVLPMGSSSVDMLTTKAMTDDSQNEATPLYEKYNALLHGESRSKKDHILSMEFMKKYIYIAKTLKPSLTQEACDTIAEEYSRLRVADVEHSDMARTQPVTPRMLETLIRLSTAHAKARLSKTVDLQDAELAIELVQYATFKKVLEKEKKSKRGRDDGEDSDEEEEDEPEEQKSKRAKSGKQPGDEGYDPFEFEDVPVSPKKKLAKKAAEKAAKDAEDADETMDTEPAQTQLSQERLSTFKSSLTKLFRDERAQSIPMKRVKDFMKSEHKTSPFSQGDIDSALTTMMDENKVMLAEDVLFLI